MREIKFRAWDGEKMIYFDFDDIYGGKFEDSTTISSLEIQQFTGLQDKNGKDIYEGDIVVELDADGQNPSKYKIEFIDNGYKIGKDVKVIGNIYDNKSLIK